jgi:hypothetical protein
MKSKAAAAMLIAGLLAGAACAAEPEPTPDAKALEQSHSSAAVAPYSAPYTRVELRRQNTGRGTPDETSRTTLRLEHYLTGTLSRLRLDLPFPDEKTDFEGDPFSPRPGDLKLRADFRRFRMGASQMSTDMELTFPTADPSSLGQGKYQVGAGLHSGPGAAEFVYTFAPHQLHSEWSVRQTVSFAGDPARKNINNTKPELALRDTIGTRHWLKLTFKPTIDWIQDGKTGAVLELEGGWNASRDWRFSIMGGVGLWGEGVPGYYSRRLELVAGRAF